MRPDSANPTLGWNLARDLGEVLEYHFMVNALLAGSVVAVMAGLVGWLMVLRREAFAGHTLSMMAFPGASGAALIGNTGGVGLFHLLRRRRSRDRALLRCQPQLPA
jgi:zinc/manganese transport system permease protein